MTVMTIAMVHMVMHGVRIIGRIGRILAALVQPALHKGDFIGLAGVNASSHGDDVRRAGAICDQVRHLNGLKMVHNHVTHELDVRFGEAVGGDLNGFFRADLTDILAGRAWLDDRRFLREGARIRRKPGSERERSGLKA
jgi:hypothetical protein